MLVGLVVRGQGGLVVWGRVVGGGGVVVGRPFTPSNHSPLPPTSLLPPLVVPPPTNPPPKGCGTRKEEI